MTTLRLGKATILSVVVAIFAIWLTFAHFIELSGFAVAVGKLALLVISGSVIDRFPLGEFNSKKQIEDENLTFGIVYSFWLLACAIVIASV